MGGDVLDERVCWDGSEGLLRDNKAASIFSCWDYMIHTCQRVEID